MDYKTKEFISRVINKLMTDGCTYRLEVMDLDNSHSITVKCPKELFGKRYSIWVLEVDEFTIGFLDSSEFTKELRTNFTSNAFSFVLPEELKWVKDVLRMHMI